MKGTSIVFTARKEAHIVGADPSEPYREGAGLVLTKEADPQPLPALYAAGVLAAFTGRAGGTSREPFNEANLSLQVGDDPLTVRANRRRLVLGLGIAGRPLVTVRQWHTAISAVVQRQELPNGPAELQGLDVAADAMVTTDDRVALMVGVADCVPIILADPLHRVIAALHVGWRGLERGLISVTVDHAESFGAERASCVAAIGPAIGSCCYAVNGATRAAVATRWPMTEAVTRSGLPSLDLVAGTEEELRRAGVESIERNSPCTADAPAEYFSVRRDGRTGCQAAVVALL
jgi:polyphenol oxidase